MRRILLAVLALTGASPALAQSAPPPAPDYSNPAHWLCLPDRSDDICARRIEVTELTAQGWGATRITAMAKDPPIDCFYVYPTISSDPGLNSDLIPTNSEENYVTQYEFARFPEVCRPFVPIYRQMTMASIAIAATGGDVLEAGMLAYGDVRDAFNHYMEHHNGGRPYVLIGHSQGAIMLDELIANHIDGSPARANMLRAYLAGWNFPLSGDVNRPARYSQTELCRDETDTGCLIAWSTFGEGKVPPPAAMFGRAPAGQRNACVHPGSPGAEGWAPLDGFFNARSRYPVPGGPVRWSRTGEPPTSYTEAPDFLEARCREEGNAGWLEIRLRRGPGDARTRRIGGEVGQFGIFLPGWGKHLYDISIAQGSIIADIARLGETYRSEKISSTD